jgi:hypothetical protein
MASPGNKVAERLRGLTKRRWPAVAAIVLVLYTLLGFFLAPALVEKAAVNAAKANLDSALTVEKVSFNPFVLSLRIDGLELDGPNSEPVARTRQIFINFQLSSLFRRAWTFAEIRFDAPDLYLSRDGSGILNLASLVAPDQGEPSQPPAGESAGMPRIFIHDFAVDEASVDWRDQFPPEPVETVFGPVSVRILALNTLPERAGEQEVVITTDTQGTLTWSGSLQLNPLASTGSAAVKGSHFPLISAYIRHDTGLDIVDGLADIELDYSVSTDADGQLRAAIDNLDIEFSDILINTFHANPDDARSSRQLLSVAGISLTDGTVRWPEREVGISYFGIDNVGLDLVRLQSGEFDFAERGKAPGSEQTWSRSSGTGPDWNLSLDRFALTNLTVGLIDRSVEPVADIGADAVNLEVHAISNEPGAAFPTTLSMSGRHGGTVRVDGTTTVLPAPVLEFDLSIDGLSLAAAHPYLQLLADVNFDSGALNLEGRFRHDGAEPFALEADIEIVDFLITETDEGTRLGSWERLFADQLTLSAGEGRIGISEIRLERLYGDILIAADGSVNLGRVSKASEDEAEEAVANEASDTAEPSAFPFSVTIGRVLINDAAVDFTDESLPLPFSAKIKDLGGSLSTIATDSTEPSMVELEGAVDEYGLVRVTGFLMPLEVAQNTDIDVVFKNVDMPKFSAYTIPFAGREIASGRLDLDLDYQVVESRLVGENKIVLRDFELGDKVPHAGAASLPLGLAVALLKDSTGKIDIDLPVSGDLNDPEFGYGGVVTKALTNLIVKIVASPFALLGNLVGAEADELEYINFPAGRADLSPPELERVEKLAEALNLRPELALVISGVIDREVDALALRTIAMDEAIESRIDAGSPASGDETQYAERRYEAIEALYRETLVTEPVLPQELRTQFTSAVVDEETGAEVARFDSLAYTAELRLQLIDSTDIAESALVDLARSRAQNARDAVLAADPALQGRVTLVELREEEAGGPADSVRMKVSLSVGEALP